jgi:hypothetical protein
LPLPFGDSSTATLYESRTARHRGLVSVAFRRFINRDDSEGGDWLDGFLPSPLPFGDSATATKNLGNNLLTLVQSPLPFGDSATATQRINDFTPSRLMSPLPFGDSATATTRTRFRLPPTIGLHCLSAIQQPRQRCARNCGKKMRGLHCLSAIQQPRLLNFRGLA